MPCVYELWYPGPAEEGDERELYATKAEADFWQLKSEGLAILEIHDYEPTKVGVAKLLNKVCETRLSE